MKSLWFIAVFACWFVFCGCTKPPHIRAGGDYDDLGPLVTETRLSDTISKSFTDTLHLENIKGSTFRYPSGVQSSYFIYRAEPNAVLDALGRLPFALHDQTADVGFHEMSTTEWAALRQTVGLYEISGAAFFWDADPEDFNIYVSVKKELHLLLVDKSQQRIFHRIASRS